MKDILICAGHAIVVIMFINAMLKEPKDDRGC